MHQHPKNIHRYPKTSPTHSKTSTNFQKNVSNINIKQYSARRESDLSRGTTKGGQNGLKRGSSNLGEGLK